MFFYLWAANCWRKSAKSAKYGRKIYLSYKHISEWVRQLFIFFCWARNIEYRYHTCSLHNLITYFNKGLRKFWVQTSHSLCLTSLWSVTGSRAHKRSELLVRFRAQFGISDKFLDYFYVHNSTLLHLPPPLRFHCVEGCCGNEPRTVTTFGIDCQTL